ncbi:M20/M25/M40 family metallo-hydrolase [Terriglobus aquaticus]|uniref:M20/M25/M40 family metallo-hydrolase n=1 Tax=Terriglobus aquaticus TaxID=940139 RepID=A0ABW9KK58_9BACT|nr:M20/M25/M40 family metallo-hydrolase [Terriglobus aquaticus]
MNPAAFARTQEIAARASTHRAFRWLHLQEQRIQTWQREAVSIPAPPFGEHDRASWFADRFREIGLCGVHLDEEGNALGWLRAPQAGEPVVLLSAHLDTVFSAAVQIAPVQDGSLLRAPGAADNGAGLAALLALAAVSAAEPEAYTANVLFAANVGEEAEGNLRGMRHIFERSAVARDVVASIALEGAGTETLVTRGLGSRRFRVVLNGPGGHAWTEPEIANPVMVLAGALARCVAEPIPQHPRTVFNVGCLEGGSSVTSIPEQATALVDIRSVSADELVRLEVLLYRSVEDAVLASNAQASRGVLTFRIECIGDRPAGALDPQSPVLASVRAVDRHLRLRTEERIGSTDANLPLAQGRDAVAMGAGGTAGGIHTLKEWYDSTGRELALRRILLVLLDVSSAEYLQALPATGRVRGATRS